MTTGFSIGYRLNDDTNPVLTPCSALVEPDIVIGDIITNTHYGVRFHIINPYICGVYIIGKFDEPFTTKESKLTFRHNGESMMIDGDECAKHLVKALGDKPIRETDVVGILSNRKIVKQLVDDISKSFPIATKAYR